MASRDEPAALGGLNDFVKKLFQMLLQDKYQDVVRWTENGHSFVVLNTNEFTKVILPRHFKHLNFASFVRQLNKYDFHKVKISSEEKQTYQYGDDAWEFQHPEFRKDDKDALENIRRKPPSKKEPAVEATINYSLHLNQLRLELAKLQTDHKALSDKYKAVLESMAAFRTYNERQYRSIGVLVHTLNLAGIKVPPLELPNPNLLGMVMPPQAVPPAVAAAGPPSAEKTLLASVSVHGLPQQPAPPGVRRPLASEAVAPTPATFEPVPGGGNVKFHVLLVEDDNVCIQLCRKFLMKYGCLVTVVTDGLSAVSTVEHTKYDLVLMDIVMPNLDGATATSIIRSFDLKTPIIAMTGNIQDNDLVTYLQNGMSDILAKPFTKDDLYLILSKHLLGTAKPEFELPPEFSNLPIEGLLVLSAQQMLPMNPPLAQLAPALIDPMEPIEQQLKKPRMH